ncbi:MAG TPA: lytic transglycosylase domain-containing protein [Thermoanaerobaculia bacterium]|nr:lytic transglycosylase domain-containing protein [Thermoanaerobaculia bacterium]
MRRVDGRRKVLPALVVLLVPVLLGSAQHAPEPAAPAGFPRADGTAARYVQAAAALRARQCGYARELLDPLARGRTADAAFARLVSGLHAHACEDLAAAEERLYAAAHPGGPLEDWRLYVLADAAAARGHVLVSQAALAKLVADYPGSALRAEALVKAAELAWRRGDSRRALDLVAAGRRESTVGEVGARLESLAWTIGGALADREVQETAARRLLADAPARAAELEVVELFRRPDGALLWSQILAPEALRRRAASLLALGIPDSALTALDSVPSRDRDFAWALAKAEVLLAGRRGAEALDLLAPWRPQGALERVELEWARARAALEAAAARRGRANLRPEERALLRRQGHQHLERVVQLGVNRERSVAALRALYDDLGADDGTDAALDALRRLRLLDPADTTGARDLWDLGWREYRRDNYTGAIGIWTELALLYPENAAARRGRYWTARAFETLGEGERAAQIYGEVATADTTDFYRKNALARVRRAVPAGTPAAAEPWPEEPLLRQARLLTDLGLDDLALSEIGLVRERAQLRAVHATEALVLANKGQRRPSIQVISRAYPALGGAHQAGLPDAARRLYYPLDHEATVRGAARGNGLPVPLVLGIIRQESAFDRTAVSWAGARGLMQLMPGTAREVAGRLGLGYSSERLSDPAYNVQLGTSYFRQVLTMFDGNVELALAGYNGGPYRIKRLWRESGERELDRFLETLDLEESRTYVKRILVLSDSYRQLYPESTG